MFSDEQLDRLGEKWAWSECGGDLIDICEQAKAYSALVRRIEVKAEEFASVRTDLTKDTRTRIEAAFIERELRALLEERG